MSHLRRFASFKSWVSRLRLVHRGRIVEVSAIVLSIAVSAPCFGAAFNWEAHDGYRTAHLSINPGEGPGFTLMSGNSTGVLFTNQLSPEAEAQNQNLPNGSGIALGDVDNDGWCDIFLCNLNGSCALFRNLGDWKFTNITFQAGLANTNWLARGAVFADVDGNGTLDLLLTRSGQGTRLFLNNGQGVFHESTPADFIAETGSTSLTLADIDGDGDLDLYVANYGENTIRSGIKFATRQVGGKEQVIGRMRNRLKILGGYVIEYGEPGVLYRNDGHGGFLRASWTDGTFLDEDGAPLTMAPWDLGLSAVMRDINQDGAPDLYVCDDFQTPDRIWLNDGSGHFRAVRREAIRMTSQFSMAVDFADINHDGYDDFMVTDMLNREHSLRIRQMDTPSPPPEQTLEKVLDRPQIHRNTLFVNRGDGTYAEIANYAGVAASDWSWSVNFLDVDLDGWEDILVGAGSRFYDTLDLDALERTKALPPSQRFSARLRYEAYPPLPNFAFRNRGDLTFEEVGHAWGFDAAEVSNSLAFADLDNDGALDVVVNCLNSTALLYRNHTSAPRLAVVLRGRPPNTRGVGARIKVLGGAVPVQSQELICGGRYLAGDAPMRVFAAGSMTNRMTLEVTWRSGKRSIVRDLTPNQIVEVDETVSQVLMPESRPVAKPLFEESQFAPAPNRQEIAFDEFTRQPLLPARLSALGPGLAWIDFAGTCEEMLVLGGRQGGKNQFFQFETNGNWRLVSDSSHGTLPDDATGLAAWSPGKGQVSLLAGLSNYKSAQRFAGIQYISGNGILSEAGKLPGNASSPGPIAVADVDGDGDLDVFVGGRMIPGRYPEAAASRLFECRNGELIPSADNRLFEQVGLVSGAIFTDLDGDGAPELVLACDWGGIKIFRRTANRWRETTQEWGLANLEGLWTSISAGDFDGDGRMDLAVGNIGLNSAYQQVAPGPWHLFYGDLNGDGQLQIVEAFHDQEINQNVPWRQLGLLEKSLPWLRGKFPTHKSFSTISIEQMLAGHDGSIRHVSAKRLATTLFLNRGDHFEFGHLPPEAQWAPVFGISVADFDNDGCEDLFLCQNNYAVRPEDPRLDAGRGLLLRGDGHGGFAAVSGMESGIKIYGEQRGCAVADFNRDGRTDLAVAEQNGTLHLFRNTGAKPGLRVRLVGPPGNPAAIGAVVRLRFSDRFGPARELHGGGGYWSQDSTSLVLAMPTVAQSLDVRWPGGKTTTTSLPANAASVVVDEQGRIRP